MPAEKKTPGVWTIGFNKGLWVNQHLMKDVGLIPYMFHKLYGFKPALLGCDKGEFPYAKLLHGIRLVPLPSDPKEYHEASIRFLREHADEMDLLVMIGHYEFYYTFMREYRRLRPDGKVYMSLDASIYWVNDIQWTSPEFCALMDGCDVIAIGSRHLQRYLNRKWNRWVINYIPNGFFNPTGREISVSVEQKENILLTVGRIGSPVKNHTMLLEAFAQVHKQCEGWQLRLVGGVEADFKPYIEEYFKRFPKLREKVFFRGIVEDKCELYEEYARARVFVLTSVTEGGAPNVVGEALAHGCYMVTSTIDAWEDIIDSGCCGKVFKVHEPNALADILREICPNDALFKEAFPKILAHSKNNFEWEVLTKRLHHMLYEE